ncbi:MAG TPA: adenosine deaminase [Aggregatilineales bacterium]|nr:adenosine deaminase [Anaerolineales bacterium]HRE47645.1 adenosine deaminase [Aggregatilineales bacterium]
MPDLRATIAAMPKIELHRHLEGSIRLTTLAEVAEQYALDVPSNRAELLRPYVQVMPGAPRTADHFLSKFAVLRGFYCAPEVVYRAAREAVEDAAADNIRYMELRFTPKALGRAGGFTFPDVVTWVCDGVRDGMAGRSIEVRLIVAVNRHESLSDAEESIQAALDQQQRGIVAVDLCGQERGFPAAPFRNLFREARRAGMFVSLHGGEWDGAHNIRYAIEAMGARRIGHGVRIFEDELTVALAAEMGVVFEVCPTSNIQSGVVPSLKDHPIQRMMAAGLRVTLNTDDPAICDVTLSEEYYRTAIAHGWTLDVLQSLTQTAAEAAFLPEMERAALIERIQIASQQSDHVIADEGGNLAPSADRGIPEHTD